MLLATCPHPHSPHLHHPLPFAQARPRNARVFAINLIYERTLWQQWPCSCTHPKPSPIPNPNPNLPLPPSRKRSRCAALLLNLLPGKGKMNLSKLFEWHSRGKGRPEDAALAPAPAADEEGTVGRAAKEMRQSKQMAARHALGVGRAAMLWLSLWLLFHSGIPHSHPRNSSSAGSSSGGSSNSGGSFRQR